MTEDQRKQYEEAANRYAALYSDQTRPFISGAFKSGCSHAHSKIEEAEMEAYNRALTDVVKLIYSLPLPSAFIESELKKLRR